MLRSDRLKPSLVRYYMVWANKCCNEKVQMLWNRNGIDVWVVGSIYWSIVMYVRVYFIIYYVYESCSKWMRSGNGILNIEKVKHFDFETNKYRLTN